MMKKTSMIAALGIALAALVISPAAAPADPAAESPYAFHLRIFENDTLAFSTWLGENGTLHTEPADGSPIVMNGSAFPSVMAPLAEVMAAVGFADRIDLEGFRLAEANHTTVRVKMEHEISAEGWMDPARVPEAVLDNLPTTLLLGEMPIEATRVGDGVRYRIIPFDGSRATAKTAGLYYGVEVDGAIARLKLSSPSAAFSSLGCTPVPGTLIPPGYYVQREVNNGVGTFDVYASKAEQQLSGATVNLEVTFTGG